MLSFFVYWIMNWFMYYLFIYLFIIYVLGSPSSKFKIDSSLILSDVPQLLVNVTIDIQSTFDHRFLQYT